MQTTPQGFKYVEPADAIADFPTPDQTNWKLVEARTPRRVTSAQMSALTGLVDGQEIELEVDAAAGVYWRLRYRAASASPNRWEFVGGPPLFAQILTDETLAATVYSDLTTVGPALTVPRAGDYMARFGADIYHVTAGGNCMAAPKRGAAAVSDADWIVHSSASVSAHASCSRELLLAGLLAADLVKLQYKTGSGGGGHFSNRYLSVIPVRVA